MTKTLAETFNNYVNWLALYLFLTAVNLTMEAGAYLVSDSTAELLRNLSIWPSRAGGIAIIVAVVTWLRVPREKRGYREQRALLGEYVWDAVKRASFLAFFITLCLVAILDVITNHTQLPADFFIKLPGISLTVVFSFAFFFFNRHSRGEEDGRKE